MCDGALCTGVLVGVLSWVKVVTSRSHISWSLPGVEPVFHKEWARHRGNVGARSSGSW